MTVKRVRIHGRGGQGVVTAARLLAPALYSEDHNVQAIPEFGVERRGAPVQSYLKFTDSLDEVIPARTYVHEPDYVVCMDDSLFDTVDVTEGLTADGLVLVNSPESPEDVDVDADRVATVDARKIAGEVIGGNIVNTIILGSFAAATDEVSLESITEAIEEKFPGDYKDQNVEAVKQGYEKTVTA